MKRSDATGMPRSLGAFFVYAWPNRMETLENDMTDTDASPMQAPAPHPALARLEPLVGRWALTGRTPDAGTDNITGWLAAAWLPGGHFLELRGAIDFKGFVVESLEVIGYDKASDTFASTVYSNVGAEPASYFWDVRENTVTHWTTGAKYTGTLSEDGSVLSGGWRPDGDAGEPGSDYDAVMTRIDGSDR